MTDSESVRELAPRPAGTTEGADRDPSIGSQAPEVVGICTTFTRRPTPSLGTIPLSPHYPVCYQTWSRILAEPLQRRPRRGWLR
jgi:hypothetical protein